MSKGHGAPSLASLDRRPSARRASERAPVAGLAIDFAHDDVDGADDGGDVGQEDVLAHVRGDGEVAEVRAAGLDAARNRRAVAA